MDKYKVIRYIELSLWKTEKNYLIPQMGKFSYISIYKAKARNFIIDRLFCKNVL